MLWRKRVGCFCFSRWRDRHVALDSWILRSLGAQHHPHSLWPTSWNSTCWAERLPLCRANPLLTASPSVVRSPEVPLAPMSSSPSMPGTNTKPLRKCLIWYWAPLVARAFCALKMGEEGRPSPWPASGGWGALTLQIAWCIPEQDPRWILAAASLTGAISFWVRPICRQLHFLGKFKGNETISSKFLRSPVLLQI